MKTLQITHFQQGGKVQQYLGLGLEGWGEAAPGVVRSLGTRAPHPTFPSLTTDMQFSHPARRQGQGEWMGSSSGTSSYIQPAEEF